MRILYLADLGGYSHDRKWIFELSQQKEVECYVVCNRLNYNKLSEADLEEIKRLNIHLVGSIELFSIRRFWKTIKYFLYLKKVIEKEKIDVLHIMYADPNALWAIFNKMFGVPLIITTRGSDINIGLKSVFERKGLLNKVLFSLYKIAFNNADSITSTSLDQLTTIKSEFAPRGKQLLVRTGATLNFNADTETPSVIPEYLNEKKIVFFPRSQRPIYNHEFAIEAICKLPKEILHDYTFVFVNSDSHDQVYVNKIKLLLSNNLNIGWEFLPTLSKRDMIRLYSRAALVVMTPLNDGSPVSAMEAMMTKTPVVLPPLEYDKEIFKETTFQFKSWKTEELADLISSILQNPDSTNDKVKLAYEVVMERGNFENQMKRVFELYQSIQSKCTLE